MQLIYHKCNELPLWCLFLKLCAGYQVLPVPAGPFSHAGATACQMGSVKGSFMAVAPETETTSKHVNSVKTRAQTPEEVYIYILLFIIPLCLFYP